MHLYILGFMGSGKTTLFDNWREQYRDFSLDFDWELASRFGIKPDELGAWIEKFGWEEFRKAEATLLEETLLSGRGLYSLGGGTFSQSNIKRFKGYPEAMTLWLNTPVEICWERVKNDRNRPLVKAGKDEFFALYAQREALYSQAKYSLSGEGKLPSLDEFWKNYVV